MRIADTPSYVIASRARLPMPLRRGAATVAAPAFRSPGAATVAPTGSPQPQTAPGHVWPEQARKSPVRPSPAEQCTTICRPAWAWAQGVLEGLFPARRRSARGWAVRCYGSTWHSIVNDEGELLAVRLTPGNVDDRQPVERLATRLGGQLCGDRGEMSPALP